MSSVNFGGLASGLDTGAIIEALMATARRPITLAEEKKAALNSKLKAYGTLSSSLAKLRTTARTMDTSREIRAFSAQSSDTSVLEAVASSGANPGSYALTVNNLAQAERTYSDPFASKDVAGLFGDGTLTITDGSGTPVDVIVDATDTLENVASKINDATAAVNAAVVFDGASYRLLVMGEDTGAANAISFAEAGSLTLDLDDPANEAQAALDATVTMDGITFNSQTNQLTEMIPGLTIDLKAASADAITIKVDLDVEAMTSKLSELVKDYNSVASFLHSQFTYNGAANIEGLMGEGAARTAKSRLQAILGDEVAGAGGAFSRLSELGVSTASDGTLSFDTRAFKEALARDPDGVVGLFAFDDGDENLDTDGVAVRLVNALDALLQDPDGLIPTREKGLQKSIDVADDRIEDLEYRLDDYEDLLRRQFAAMEEAMAQYNSTGTFLAQQVF